MSETIYSLVPHVPVVPVKPPMHKSKHNHGCALAGSTFGERHMMMLQSLSAANVVSYLIPAGAIVHDATAAACCIITKGRNATSGVG